MESRKAVQKRLIRLGQILKVFMERDKTTSSWLSQHFNTTPRTIQRDILMLREAGFPLHEIQKGTYEMSKDLVKNLEVFDDTELALIVAMKNLVGQLGQPLRQAADGVLNRLYDYVMSIPVFVRIDESVSLDGKLLDRIIKTIQKKKQAFFTYDGKKKHDVTIEPYRVAYFEGFWYLIGMDVKACKLKKYALDKIRNFKTLNFGFKCIPEDLDQKLSASTNVWFDGTAELKVLISVAPTHADYFKRKKYYPTQEIVEEKRDGTLIVSYTVGYYEAIRNMIKSWIPFVTVLEPEELRKNLVKDVSDWVRKQSKI